MTDRELIEAAAKVAEIPGKWDERDDGWFVPGGNEGWLWLSRWDPLNDDRDAFRLAVKLGLRVRVTDKVAVVDIYKDNGWDGTVQVDSNQDPLAAARLAIVQAAAELGKEMK